MEKGLRVPDPSSGRGPNKMEPPFIRSEKKCWEMLRSGRLPTEMLGSRWLSFRLLIPCVLVWGCSGATEWMTGCYGFRGHFPILKQIAHTSTHRVCPPAALHCLQVGFRPRATWSPTPLHVNTLLQSSFNSLCYFFSVGGWVARRAEVHRFA